MKKLSRNKKIILAMVIMFVLIAAALIIYFAFIKTEYRKCSIKEALEELDGYKFGSYDNLEFDCGVNKFENDKLYDLTIHFEQVPSDFDEKEITEKAKEAARVFGGIDDFSTAEIMAYDMEGEVDISDDTQGYYVDFYSTYSFGYADLEKDDWWKNYIDENNDDEYFKGTNPTSVLRYNVQKDGVPDETFINYRSEEVSIAEVAKSGDEIIEEKMKPFLIGEENEDLKLADIYIYIYIMEQMEGKYFCRLVYAFEYNGMTLNKYGYVSDVDSLRSPFVALSFVDENELTKIDCDVYEGRHISGSKKVGGRIYPLSSAEQMLSDHLASHKKYVVTEVSLQNVSISDYGEEYQTYSPTWVFLLEDYGSDMLGRKGIVAFVDAKTGEIEVYNTEMHASFDELNM